MLRRLRVRAALATALCAGALGCGGEEDEETPPDSDSQAAALARLLPAGELPGVIVADVAAAREANGLDSDADPLEGFPGGTPEEQRFAGAFIGMRDVTSPMQTPIRDAVDHGAISAYATNLVFGEGAILLFSTSQPFDEIASALEADGYERDGELLVSGGSAVELSYTVLAEADGYIVMGQDATTVEAVAGGTETSGAPEASLVESLEGPVSAAASTESGCLESIVINDRMDGTAELRLMLSSEPDPEAFTLDDSDTSPLPIAGYSVEEPVVDGQTLAVEVEANPDTPALSPVGLLSADVPAGSIYDCG